MKINIHTFPSPSERQKVRPWRNAQISQFAVKGTLNAPFLCCSAIHIKNCKSEHIHPCIPTENNQIIRQTHIKRTISASTAAFCLSNISWIFCFFSFCISFNLAFSRFESSLPPVFPSYHIYDTESKHTCEKTTYNSSFKTQ